MAEVIDLAKSAEQRKLQQTGELYSKLANDLFTKLAAEGLNTHQITQFLAITAQVWGSKTNDFLSEVDPQLIICPSSNTE